MIRIVIMILSLIFALFIITDRASAGSWADQELSMQSRLFQKEVAEILPLEKEYLATFLHQNKATTCSTHSEQWLQLFVLDLRVENVSIEDIEDLLKAVKQARNIFGQAISCGRYSYD